MHKLVLPQDSCCSLYNLPLQCQVALATSWKQCIHNEDAANVATQTLSVTRDRILHEKYDMNWKRKTIHPLTHLPTWSALPPTRFLRMEHFAEHQFFIGSPVDMTKIVYLYSACYLKVARTQEDNSCFDQDCLRWKIINISAMIFTSKGKKVYIQAQTYAAVWCLMFFFFWRKQLTPWNQYSIRSTKQTSKLISHRAKP